jgi:hypothetical protein
MGEGELELCLPSPILGRGAGGEGKDLSLHCDAPHQRFAVRYADAITHPTKLGFSLPPCGHFFNSALFINSGIGYTTQKTLGYGKKF